MRAESKINEKLVAAGIIERDHLLTEEQLKIKADIEAELDPKYRDSDIKESSYIHNDDFFAD